MLVLLIPIGITLQHFTITKILQLLGHALVSRMNLKTKIGSAGLALVASRATSPLTARRRSERRRTRTSGITNIYFQVTHNTAQLKNDQ